MHDSDDYDALVVLQYGREAVAKSCGFGIELVIVCHILQVQVQEAAEDSEPEQANEQLQELRVVPPRQGLALQLGRLLLAGLLVLSAHLAPVVSNRRGVHLPLGPSGHALRRCDTERLRPSLTP